MTFHYGIVEDINDPLEMGRVRVRVYGLHTHETVNIPTDSLPWATVVQSTHSAANSGVGTTSRLLNNTLVMLHFLDGTDFQCPVVIGTIPTQVLSHIIDNNGTKIARNSNGYGFQDPEQVYPTSEYQDSNDYPKLARTATNEFERSSHTSDNVLFGITEPEDIRSNHKYPHNQVKQSTSGHHEEWDDTPTNERLNRQHMSGTFEEIRPDGTIVRKIVGKNFEIVQDDVNVYVKGNVNLHIDTNCNTYIKGDWNIQVDGNVNETVNGNVNVNVLGNQSETVIGSQTSAVTGSVSENYGASQTTTVSASQTQNVSGNMTLISSRLDLNP